MKNIILFLAGILFFFPVCAQTKWPAMWKPGQTKTVEGHQILKESGQGSPFISWETLEKNKADYAAIATKELWTADSLAGWVSYLEETQPGGSIIIKIVRTDIDWGNTDNFTVVIFDATGTEVHRETLPSSAPDYQISGGQTFWHNFGIAHIPVPVTVPFKVVVIDSAAPVDADNYVFIVKS